MKVFPKIIKINKIKGFDVYCAFNNGEHRVINFNILFNKLNFKRDEMKQQIMKPAIFKTVTLSSNTLTWEKVRKKITLNTGQSFDVAFDLDPFVLYENSTLDLKEPIAVQLQTD